MFSRRGWWLATGLCLALSVPATASAQSGTVGAGASDAGTHVAKSRYHLKKLTPAQRLRSRGSLTLSRATRFGRLGVRAATASQPTITVKETQFGCALNVVGVSSTTNDTIAWVENYAPSLYSDMLTCQGNNGVTGADAHLEAPNPNCRNPYGQSVHTSPDEQAQFSDGEYILICNTPDDNGSGGSNANNSPYTSYKQGFSCGAVAGVGSDDNTVYRAKTSDSIEFYQNYVDYSGNATQAITTSCLGQLPSSVTVAPTAVAHFVACYQYNPNPGGGTVLGYGETVTFPDRQYSETCTTPNYHPTPAAT